VGDEVPGSNVCARRSARPLGDNVRALVILICLVLPASDALACKYSSETVLAESRANAVTERRHQIRVLAAEATSIYLASVKSVSRDGGAATFEIQRILKGQSTGTPDMTYALTREVTINSCDFGASMFRTALAEGNGQHLLYVVGSQLVRSVSTSTTGLISPADEIRELESSLPSDKSLERTPEE